MSPVFSLMWVWPGASPVTGLNVLPVWPRVQEAGQAGEASRDGVPLVKTEAAAQRIRAGRARRALLSGHL